MSIAKPATMLAALTCLTCLACRGRAPRGSTSGELRSPIDVLRTLPYVAAAPQLQEPTGVLTHRRRLTQPGVNFYADRFHDTARLLSNDGAVLWQWEKKSSASWGHVEPLRSGELLAIQLWDVVKQADYPDEKGFESYIIKLSASSSLLWKTPVPAHHDIQVLPSGRLLTLTERIRRVESIDRDHATVDNGVALLSPTGAVLDEFSIYDAVRQSPLVKLTPVAPDGRGLVDLFHCNSIQFVPAAPVGMGVGDRDEAGNVLICSRHQNLVFLVSLQTHRVLWAWGQQDLSGPHSARLLETGNVLVFDNGLGRDHSRVLEIEPGSHRIVWNYRGGPETPLTTPSGGYCQRLQNGHTLITDSVHYQAFEVSPDGETVWRFVSPEQSFVYRLHRYAVDYFAPAFRRRWLTSEAD